MMPERKFVRSGAQSKSHNLMAQAYSKNRLLTDELANISSGVIHGCRIPWSIRQKNAIRIKVENVGGARR